MATVNLATITATAKLITGPFVKSAKVVTGTLKKIAKSAAGTASSLRFIGGAAALGGIAAAIKTLANFEDSIAGIRSILQLSVKDVNALNSSLQALGAESRRVALDSKFTASEVAGAAEIFVRAGISARDTFDALEGIAQFGAAANIEDLKEAANSLTFVVNAFSLSGKEVSRVADILVGASAQSQATVQQLSKSLELAAGIAADFNQSIEDVATTFAIFARGGIIASRAGTTLRQVFVALQKDIGKPNKSILSKLNIDLTETNALTGKLTNIIRPLPDLFAEIGAKASRLDLISLFPTRALAGVLRQVGVTESEFFDLVTQISRTGTAADVAGTRIDTLSGDFLQLKAAAEELVLVLGFKGGLLAEIRNAIQSFRDFVRDVASVRKEFLQLATQSFVLATQVGLASLAFIAIAGSVALVLSPLGVFITTILGLDKGVEIVKKFKSEIADVVALITGSLLAAAADFAGSFINLISGAIFEVSESLKAIGSVVIGTSETFGDFSLSLGPIASVLSAVSGGLDKAAVSLLFFRLNQEDANKVLKASVLEQANARAATAAFTSTLKTFSVVAGGVAGQAILALRSRVQGLKDSFKEIGKDGEIQKLSDDFENLAASAQLQGLFDEAVEEFKKLKKIAAELKEIGDPLEAAQELFKETFDALREVQIPEAELALIKLNEEFDRLLSLGARISPEVAAKIEELRDKSIEAQTEVNKLADTFSIDLLQGARRALNEIVSGLLRGTRESFKFGDVVRDVLISTFTDAFAKIIAEKLKFDVLFKNNMLDLASFTQSTFEAVVGAIGGLFGGLFGGGGGGGFNTVRGGTGPTQIPGGGSAFSAIASILPFASGGIVTSPRLGLVGEAGPEAVIPLDRLQGLFGGGGGGSTEVNVIFAGPPQNVEKRERSDPFKKIVDVIIGEVDRRVLMGGSTQRAIAGSFRGTALATRK